MTALIITIFIFVFALGFITIFRRYQRILKEKNFGVEYRNRFVEFANKYFETTHGYYSQKNFDTELYIWLTKNVNEIQANLGHLGKMHYVAAFQMYEVKNYEVVINTLPKFRDGKIESFDVNSTDDCLLRYIGSMKKIIESLSKKLKNPIIWFKEGFQEIISLPLYIFNWFGILSDRAVARVTTNVIWKVLAGLGGLVTFVSGIVTIIQGKDQTIELLRHWFGR